jgi:hypothetical protein
LDRHRYWLAFANAYRDEPLDLPWWSRIIELGGRRIHVSGLDSAWMSVDGQDHGKLLLGLYQLNDTVQSAEAEAGDLNIALVHHPWSFLAEFDVGEAEAIVQKHCQLVLRGHLHKQRSAYVQNTETGCLELAAGSAYVDSQWANAFQWIEIDPEKGHTRIQFHHWHEHAWRLDLSVPGTHEGWAEFPLQAGGERTLMKAARYLRDLREATGYINIRGLAVGTALAHRFHIDALYVKQGTSDGLEHDSDEEPRGGGEAGAERILAAHRRVLIGDPGAGKTTWLNWVAWTLARERLGDTSGLAKERPGLDRPLYPILLSISAWLEHIRTGGDRGLPYPTSALSSQWLLHYLDTRAQERNQGLPDDWFRERLDAGEALLLLDGLDEAPDRVAREAAVRLIEQVAAAWPNTQMVVTSRPAAFQGRVILKGFTSTRIMPLSDSGVETFLKAWGRALFPDDPRRAEDYTGELMAALEARPSIRRLARTVVMLTALAVVYWNERRLPEQRADLYESILTWLPAPSPARATGKNGDYCLAPLTCSIARNGRRWSCCWPGSFITRVERRRMGWSMRSWNTWAPEQACRNRLRPPACSGRWCATCRRMTISHHIPGIPG